MIVSRRGVTWDVTEPLPTGQYTEGPHPGFWVEWAADRWCPDLLDLIDRFVRPGSTFVDLGASIGPLSMWAAERGARAVAVEPDPVAFDHLMANCMVNVPGKVRCLEAAISDQSGVCQLTAHPSGWGMAMSSLHRYKDPDRFTLVQGGTQVYAEKQGKAVPSITVQQLFQDFNIEDCCLVKMDIEGEEAVVLETVAPFLAQRKIPLHVETHEPWWPRPIDPAWFDGYLRIEGELGGLGAALAIP